METKRSNKIGAEREKMQMNEYIKSHGLGNDYIILEEEHIDFSLTEKQILKICDVHYGIGSDGILLKVKSSRADIGLRIFNPDGSEAEKSGNGLRIFCKYVYDYGVLDKRRSFSVETKGGIVNAYIVEEAEGRAKLIKVDMGKAIFEADKIPTLYESKEVIDEEIEIDGKKYKINCVSVGNPHCVIIKDELDEEEVKRVGPLIETFKMFPNRINVQFVKVLSRDKAEILIWERGAGYTLASGSSSSAVACVLRKKGLIDQEVEVMMPGGSLQLVVDDNWQIHMTGEIKEICTGKLSEELVREL